MKYRKKIEPVEAILWDGTNLDTVAQFTDEDLRIVVDPHMPEYDYRVYKMMEEMGHTEPIHHLLVGQENIQVFQNEYIIKDVFGNYTNMYKDNFELDYEAIE